jgi:hypothetical protein
MRNELTFSNLCYWEINNPLHKDGSKSRTMGDMIDKVKMQAIGETFEFTMTYFNLSVPDGGLFYILKGLGNEDMSNSNKLININKGETWKVQFL